MSIITNFLLGIEVLVSLLIVLLVLMQRPKSEGLGAAFGGGMTENLFGAQTTNVLQKATRVLGGIFFAVALIISMISSRVAHSDHRSLIQQQLSAAPVPKEISPAAAGDDIQKVLEQKVKEATSGSSATTGTSTIPINSAAPASSPTHKTAETPATPDLAAPSLQLGPTLPQTSGTGGAGDDLQAPNFQLQTGTAGTGGMPFSTGTAKKDGGL